MPTAETTLIPACDINRRASKKSLTGNARLDNEPNLFIDGNLVNLTPGMAVTVEIKTGSRSVISYLLSPLVRYAHESLRERRNYSGSAAITEVINSI